MKLDFQQLYIYNIQLIENANVPKIAEVQCTDSSQI